MQNHTKITIGSLISLGWAFLIALIVFIYSFFSFQVEAQYATHWYPRIGRVLRGVTQFVPFSLGDIFYTILFFSIIISFIKWIIHFVRSSLHWEVLVAGTIELIRNLLWWFVVFKLVWGLNYNRMGISYQLNLDTEPYQKSDVVQLTKDLMDSLNACRRQIKDTLLPEKSFAAINEESIALYQEKSLQYPFLAYQRASVKKSLFSGMGDFLGFTGYFNPFSGEAQVRSDIPRVMVPFITCHEMAHQLGYASESEANFVGYLSAASSKDPYFRYSVYLELFSYAQGAEILLYGKEKDYPAFEHMMQYNKMYLDSLVRKDRKMIRQFFQKRKNNISPAFNNLYDQYLKLNQQAAGIESYDDVVAWLIAYKKKFGKI